MSMNSIVDWFAGGVGPTATLAALVLATVVTALAPRPVKRRLRGALVLGLFYGVLSYAAGRMEHRDGELDIRAISYLCGALAVARFLFVVSVDIGIERGGKRPMNQLPRDVLQALAYVVAGLAALRAAKIPPSSLFVTGTVVTAIIGLSLQETLGNLAAGVSIQIDRPIALGEYIHIDKAELPGRVVSTNWRAVTIQTDDRGLFVIPNGVFAKTPFTNHSRPGGGTRRSLYFTVPYEVPPMHVHEAILAACSDCPDVLTDPAPSVLTWTWNERGISYWLRYFVADYARRDISQGEVATRVWYNLHRRKIEPAIPVNRQLLYRVDEQALAAKNAETVMDRRAAIDAVDFLRPLGDEQKDMLARRGHRKLYAAEETIIRSGDTGREFYIVRHGRVGVFFGDRRIAELGPGQFFGELALLTGSPRQNNVVALEETEVFEVDLEMFADVMHAKPEIALEISRIVGERQADRAARFSGATEATAHEKQTMGGEIFGKIREMFALD